MYFYLKLQIKQIMQDINPALLLSKSSGKYSEAIITNISITALFPL